MYTVEDFKSDTMEEFKESLVRLGGDHVVYRTLSNDEMLAHVVGMESNDESRITLSSFLDGDFSNNVSNVEAYLKERTDEVHEFFNFPVVSFINEDGLLEVHAFIGFDPSSTVQHFLDSVAEPYFSFVENVFGYEKGDL